MPANEILVVGSINMDLVFRLPRLPQKGETVGGGEFAAYPGGKGANQGVAAARLGVSTGLVGCVGQDEWGNALIEGLRLEGVDTAWVQRVPGPSGCAGIYVGPRGENSIAVAPGANSRLEAAFPAGAREAISQARVLLTQLEIPLESVEAALRLAKKGGVTTILDPAPARALPPALLALVDYLTPNALEASALTGIEVHCWNTAAQAARQLRGQGAGTVIVTMGKLGAFFSSPQGQVRIPAPAVTVVDATAAGDAFNGAFAAALTRGVAPDEAADLGAVAGALAVTKKGAQPSLPRLADLREAVAVPW